NAVTRIDPRGITTKYGDDALNRQTTMIEAYRVAGQQRTTTTAYDAVGNVIRVSRPQGVDLDANGGQVPNPVHVLTSYGYHVVNRQTTLTEAFGTAVQRTTVTGYDKVGNVRSVTRAQTYDGATTPILVTTSYDYDALNRRTTMIEAVGVAGQQRT